MTKSRPRIALLAPQGWCLRNWVLTDFLQHATSQGAEVIVFSPEALSLQHEFDFDGVLFEPMKADPLSSGQQSLMRSISYAHYYRQQTFIHRYMLSRTGAGLRKITQVRGALRKGLGRILQHAPDSLLKQLEQSLLGLMPESKRLERTFRRLDIDLVFSTVPLIAHYEHPALWAAERLGLKTACIITSWDNLYSKGRLPIRFDHYLVWSDFMKIALQEHYPAITDSRVTVTGPPQFDFYRDERLLEDRGAFLRSLGGDPDRKLILWSGASMNQMPNEPDILEGFCQAVQTGKVAGNPQILVRPHPIGGGERFARIRERFPEVLFTETNDTDPRYLIHWTPFERDVALLVNTVAHADVNINHCSTMTLDCCAVDTPVVNLAFDIEGGSEMDQYVRDVYNYDHYRSVLACGAVRMAESPGQLVNTVSDYLQYPDRDRQGREDLLYLQCGRVDGLASKRASEVLIRLMNSSPHEAAMM